MSSAAKSSPTSASLRSRIESGVQFSSPESNKRPQTDSTSRGQPTRQKREKYVAVACNECKKRKIKCSGELPCRRCDTHDTVCQYSQDAREASTTKEQTKKEDMQGMHNQLEQLSAAVASLQRQVSTHESRLEELGISQVSESARPSPSAARTPGYKHQPSGPTRTQYIGPTSSAFNFKVANSTLQSMGIEANQYSTTQSRNTSPEPPPVHPQDPLLALSLEQVYHALEIYSEEFEPVYPVISTDDVMQRTPQLYQYLKSRNAQQSKPSHAEIMDRKDAELLKIIVATSLLSGDSVQNSTLSDQLVDSVDSVLMGSVRRSNMDLKELQIFTLTSIYYFHRDEEVLAWRTIGVAARIAVELGLHRKEGLEQNFPDIQERDWALRLFWCIYCLDRRWSIGTGMPLALQDSDIDPNLPRLNSSYPYLGCMVEYGKISSKVWAAVAGYGSKGIDRENVLYLDFQIQQWRQRLPTELQMPHPSPAISPIPQPRMLQRQQVLLYLRANQTRILVHRHYLLTPQSITADLPSAHLVVEVAKDTVIVLFHLWQNSTIYQSQQMAFNYFLISALSALFLAVCHAPAEFSPVCRDEFYNALEILRNLSARSYSSKRLWKSVRSLKTIAPQLGLLPSKHGGENSDAVRARQNRSGGNKPNEDNTTDQVVPQPDDGSLWMTDGLEFTPQSMVSIPDMYQMSHDLTNMFEAFTSFDDPAAGDVYKNAGFTLQDNGEISRLFEGLF